MSIELRPLTTDDLPEVCELHRRSEDFDGVPRVVTLEEMEEDLDDEVIRHATDTRLAVVDGALAGYAYTMHLPSEVKEERCYVFGEVDPAFRRRGVGTALMGWAIERGAQQLRSSGRSLPRYLRTDTYDYITGAHALFGSLGMTAVRWTDELLRPLDQLPVPGTVPGVRILPWDDARDQEIRRVKNEAFADHWGSTPTSVEHWAQMTHGHGSRLDLSFMAVDDSGAVVGHCLNARYADDDEITGRRDGWIDNLGTVRAWRGRGVASALIAHSLGAFAAAGLSHASISVDSDNPTGAARLYRGLGFEPQQRSVTWQLEID